jgi:hypothetical protein
MTHDSHLGSHDAEVHQKRLQFRHAQYDQGDHEQDEQMFRCEKVFHG